MSSDRYRVGGRLSCEQLGGETLCDHRAIVDIPTLICSSEPGAGSQAILRPLAERDETELLRIHSTPEVALWWDVPDDGFPWSDEPESTRLTIELDGVVVGMIQFSEELAPKYRHATIDLFLDPAVHGRGVGTEAVRRVVRYLIEERDHHRVTIDPGTENVAAIRSYEKVGFKPIGVMRRYERLIGSDEWRDGLLMELLADEL